MSRHPKSRDEFRGPVSIRDEYTRVPAGKVAAIVTHLEMNTRPALSEAKPSGDYSLRRVTNPSLAWYRDLYRRVGENWLWFSRLVMSDADLENLIRHPAVEVHALESLPDGPRAAKRMGAQSETDHDPHLHPRPSARAGFLQARGLRALCTLDRDRGRPAADGIAGAQCRAACSDCLILIVMAGLVPAIPIAKALPS
jgi:hypothetical protein